MRTLFCFLLLCYYQISYGQQASKLFSFTGTISNTPNGWVYLSYVDTGNHYVQDSSQLTNGKFTFKGHINSPVMADFKGKTASGSVDDPRFTGLFLEPGKMDAFFPENDFKQVRITGSKSQTEYMGYIRQTEKVKTRWRKVLDAFEAFRNNKESEKNKKIADEGLPLY